MYKVLGRDRNGIFILVFTRFQLSLLSSIFKTVPSDVFRSAFINYGWDSAANFVMICGQIPKSHWPLTKTDFHFLDMRFLMMRAPIFSQSKILSKVLHKKPSIKENISIFDTGVVTNFSILVKELFLRLPFLV